MENELTHLDLFSGIGGFALAAKWAGFRTIGFCEIDKYCQEVLAKNFPANPERVGRRSKTKAGLEMERNSLVDRSWQESPDRSFQNCRVLGDIRELDGREFASVTLVTGGFPCQPFSCAGKRRGKEDDRHLWPEMLRVVAEARPAWVLGENVAGIIGMELDTVLSDLETIGYATRSFVIPACGVDARHRRNRVWIVAHRCGERLSQPTRGRFGRFQRQVRSSEGSQLGGRNAETWEHWPIEPNVGRVAYGIPSRVDRLRGLGNAIVPQVAYQILKTIAQIERQ